MYRGAGGLEGIVSKRRDFPYRLRPGEVLDQGSQPGECCDEAIRGRHILTTKCTICDDTGWVCETHPDRPAGMFSKRFDA